MLCNVCGEGNDIEGAAERLELSASMSGPLSSVCETDADERFRPNDGRQEENFFVGEGWRLPGGVKALPSDQRGCIENQGHGF